MKVPMLLPALLLAVTACAASDSLSAPAISQGARRDGSIRNLSGTIQVSAGSTWLVRESEAVRLAGDPVAALANLYGFEVELKGTYDSVDAFLVNQFAVTRVDGMPAADGILEETDGGFGLRMANGTLRMLLDPPAALTANVGKRVWVAGPNDQPPMEFGII